MPGRSVLHDGNDITFTLRRFVLCLALRELADLFTAVSNLPSWTSFTQRKRQPRFESRPLRVAAISGLSCVESI